jgi:hypothetical protein
MLFAIYFFFRSSFCWSFCWCFFCCFRWYFCWLYLLGEWWFWWYFSWLYRLGERWFRLYLCWLYLMEDRCFRWCFRCLYLLGEWWDFNDVLCWLRYRWCFVLVVFVGRAVLVFLLVVFDGRAVGFWWYSWCWYFLEEWCFRWCFRWWFCWFYLLGERWVILWPGVSWDCSAYVESSTTILFVIFQVVYDLEKKRVHEWFCTFRTNRTKSIRTLMGSDRWRITVLFNEKETLRTGIRTL